MPSSTSDPAAQKRALIARARAEGFSAVRITTPDAIPQAAARLAGFLGAGRHGQMDWLAQRSLWRGDPTALWPASAAPSSHPTPPNAVHPPTAR